MGQYVAGRNDQGVCQASRLPQSNALAIEVRGWGGRGLGHTGYCAKVDELERLVKLSVVFAFDVQLGVELSVDHSASVHLVVHELGHDVGAWIILSACVCGGRF